MGLGGHRGRAAFSSALARPLTPSQRELKRDWEVYCMLVTPPSGTLFLSEFLYVNSANLHNRPRK